MGLLELIKVGSKFNRNRYTIVTDALTSGSASFGSAYAILSITTNTPCRFRLYDNLQSMNDPGESARNFGNNSISSSVALIGDFSMSVANVENTIDPTLYSVVENANTGWTYYRVNGATTSPTITMYVYPIEDATKVPTVGTAYAEANRRILPYITGSLSVGGIVSGTMSTGISTIPKTYLLVSASLTTSAHYARLRLYRTTSSLYDTIEKNREFSLEASESAQLIADMYLTGSETTYFSPKIIGANLQNMTTDLQTMRGKSSLIAGNNELYYILQNASTIGGPDNISASLHVYSLED